jgi:hypothetical protein
MVGVGCAWACVSSAARDCDSTLETEDGESLHATAALKAGEFFERGALAARDCGDGDLVKIAMEGLNNGIILATDS